MPFNISGSETNAEQYIDLAITYGVKLITALFILVIGLWVAKQVSKGIYRAMSAKQVDKTVSSFVRNMLYYTLATFVIVAALAKVGIQTASFIAILGAAGLAVGLALQGSLSNFASGVLLLIFRPFKSGDFVSVAGESGTVEEIQIFTTHLKTADNRAIIIPNANVLSGNIVNFSAKSTRRIDLTIGVSYDADVAHTKLVLMDTVLADDRVLQDPAPLVAVSELADNSVNFVVRSWVKSEDYWPTYFSLTETIKLRLDEEQIGIPYPQLDLHLVSNSTAANTSHAQLKTESERR